jgi:hypothetical protein
MPQPEVCHPATLRQRVPAKTLRGCWILKLQFGSQYGVELAYREDNRSLTRLWLCRLCHLDQSRRDTKTVNSYHHITDHMRKLHAIDPKTGLAPVSVQPASGSPWDAARAAGSNSIFSHTPWQEESFQSAMVDWVILKDISFSDAASSATRALLTWNRIDLLRALPTSKTTLSNYVKRALEERKIIIKRLVQSAASKVAVSVDVWTSSNYLSFLGVVAHFVGK